VVLDAPDDSTFPLRGSKRGQLMVKIARNDDIHPAAATFSNARLQSVYSNNLKNTRSIQVPMLKEPVDILLPTSKRGPISQDLFFGSILAGKTRERQRCALICPVSL
jgi:hypothetical protein